MLEASSSLSWDEIDAAIDSAEIEAERIAPSYRQTLLPDGEIVLADFKDVVVGNVGGTWRWLSTLIISSDPSIGEWGGLPILRSYNMPKRGWLSPQHSLAIDWRNVTGIPMLPLPKPPNLNPSRGKKQPSRREWQAAETRRARLYLGSFLRKVQVEVRTRVVNKQMDRKTREWVETKPSDWYSVVDRILSRTAGVPRILKRRERPL